MPILTFPMPDQIMCHDGVMRNSLECVRLDSTLYIHPNSPYALPDEVVYAAGAGRGNDHAYALREQCVSLADGGFALIEHAVEDYRGRYYAAIGLEEGWLVRLDGASNWAGQIALEDDACSTDDGWFLTGECFCCDSCCNWFYGEADNTGPGGCDMCESCFNENTTVCDHCDEVRWSDDCSDDDEGGVVCTHCRSPRRRNPRIISDYCDRSANHMQSESKDAILFGIELEVEAKGGDSGSGAEWVRNYLPDTYVCLKHDGSLGSGGFEIVTRPDSVDVHRKYWTPLLGANPGKVLQSWQTGRCGMHVHVSRAGLSQLQLGKMLCFLNDPANEGFVCKVAGRRNSRWSRIEKKKVGDIRRPYAITDRYVALNLCNRRTAEFRIFKGTLSARGFFKNLEFCAALVEFTAPCKASLTDATDYTKFCEWLSYKTYPHLYDWCVERGYIIDQRPPLKRKPS